VWIPLVDWPWLMFAIAFLLLWAVARFGVLVRNWRPGITSAEHSDLDLVRNATFTLLAVILGFSLSMAVSRYDLRKTYEEEEANAIGTEYARLDLLPAEAASATRDLLRDYARLRVIYYSGQAQEELRRAEIATAKLQNEMWDLDSSAASKQPSPLTALAVAGMNDVLNSQGYTLAAWRNRLPVQSLGTAVLRRDRRQFFGRLRFVQQIRMGSLGARSDDGRRIPADRRNRQSAQRVRSRASAEFGGRGRIDRR
jgi:hypothetical protein